MIVAEDLPLCTILISSIKNPELIDSEADMRTEGWHSSRIILYRKSMLSILREHGEDMYTGDKKILQDALNTNVDWFMFE